MCIKNKNYMENWLFWGLNLGNLKQCMMIMLVLTSSSSAWTLCSLLHISSLINICNFYSFWATGMVLTSKWGRILQEIHCQCQIWLICPFAGRRPANFHKRNYLLSVNTTDFEKTTIQAHSAMQPNQILDFLPYPTIQALKTRKDQTNNCYPSTVLFFDVALRWPSCFLWMYCSPMATLHSTLRGSPSLNFSQRTMNNFS